MLETEFETVVMVADEESLLEAARRIQPDLAVVDLSLSSESDLGWLRRGATQVSGAEGGRRQRP